MYNLPKNLKVLAKGAWERCLEGNGGRVVVDGIVASVFARQHPALG